MTLMIVMQEVFYPMENVCKAGSPGLCLLCECSDDRNPIIVSDVSLPSALQLPMQLTIFKGNQFTIYSIRNTFPRKR